MEEGLHSPEEANMSTATEYRSLLNELAPQPIRSDKDYRRALAQLEKLMVPHPSAAQSLLIEMLSTLIEKYESREYPTPRLAPAEMLRQLISARGLKNTDIAKRTGIPPATLSNVLADRRGISKANALRLAGFFGVSPAFFLAESKPPASRQKRSAPV
jgi:HTH-type transcriptional regulator/antitoxin HigA